MAWNIQALVERFGIERIGFLTLTFSQDVQDAKEAQRRLNSLATHVLRDRYPSGFVRVLERTKKGRIHYHLLVVLADDIRTGIDFGELARGDYRSAPRSLRTEWAFWRATAKRYGFGRTELLPVRSTGEGIARYVGKYLSKHQQVRQWRDVGVRLVDYSRGARIATTKFAWATDGGIAWRCKVQLFAALAGEHYGRRFDGVGDLAAFFGAKWAHRHRGFIAALPAVHAAGVRFLFDGSVASAHTGELLSAAEAS